MITLLCAATLATALPCHAEAGNTPHAENGVRKATTQRYMGVSYDETTGITPTGFPGYGVTSAASIFPKSLVSTFTGYKVVGMRYHLALANKVTRAFVMKAESFKAVGDTLSAEPIASTSQKGWNTVSFSKPFTIDASAYSQLLVGFDYTQGDEENTEPLSSVKAEISEGLACYVNVTEEMAQEEGNLQPGWQWLSMGPNTALLVQLIVEKEGEVPDHDISLTTLSQPHFGKEGQTKQLTLKCENNGTKTITKYELGVALDGKELNTAVGLYSIPVGRVRVAAINLPIPSSTAKGEHKVSVYAKSVEGKAPEGNLADDTLSTTLYVYTDTMPRQKQLVEQFTSEQCKWCPNGYNGLNALCAIRGDIAWVSCHSKSMGEDEYVLPAVTELETIFKNTSLPSGTFNRYHGFGSGELNFSLSFDDEELGAKNFNDYINASNAVCPPFASVDIASSYNPATREAAITVSGEMTTDWRSTLGEDAVLTVYLTEDSLVGTQLYGEETITNYMHRNVLRATLTDCHGEALHLTGDHSYAHTFTYTLDEAWKAEQMSVVAFIGRPVPESDANLDDLWVTNANSVKLSADPSGIRSLTIGSSKAHETSRYNLSGARLSSPTKGINLVRMSDGKVIKEKR